MHTFQKKYQLSNNYKYDKCHERKLEVVYYLQYSKCNTEQRQDKQNKHSDLIQK